MTKNRKRILSILLIMVMVFSQMGMVFADTNTDNDYLSPTPELIEFIDEYFENPTNFVVFDKSEENVGNIFYEANINRYQEADYTSIKAYIFQNVSKFSKQSEAVISEQNAVARASYVTKNVSDYFFDTVVSDDHHQPIEINYTISGRITYNANTGVISSCSAATISDFYSSPGTLWSVSMNNISTNSQIASNKFSATFSANFRIIATLVVPFGPFPVGFPFDYGWHSNSVTGYVE